MKRLLTVLLLCPLLFVFGCEEDGGRPLDDRPPETTVEASDLDTPGRTVTFRWEGSDDGDVVGFEWRLSANGEDGVVDVPDTLLVPWNETESSEETLSLDADIPGPPPGSDEDLFFQTYTLFVRAIDDRGQRDPTPAHVSVTATTVAPTVRIRERIVRTTCSELSTGYGFSWEVEDPDAQPGEELEVRWLLVPLGGPDDACLTDAQYAALSPGPIQADDARWSDWVTYVEPGGEGGRHGEASLPEPTGSNYLFAVQARDAAGAVTPMFEWFENVMHFRTAPDRYPLLSVYGPEIGRTLAVGPAGMRWRRPVPEGFELDFEASADVPFEVEAPFEYRWGVDVVDPQNDADPGWRSAWSSDAPRVEGLGLEIGPRNVTVSTRDRYGQVSTVAIGFDVLAVPDRTAQLPVLVVDEWNLVDRPDVEATQDDLVESWLASVPGFDASRDVIDLTAEPDRLSMQTMIGYRSVVWITAPSRPVSNDGRHLGGAWLTDLELFQRHVGNVLLVGPGAMTRALGPHLDSITTPLEVTNPPRDAFGPIVVGLDGIADQALLSYPRQAFGLRFLDQIVPIERGQIAGGRGDVDACDRIASVRVVPEAVEGLGIDAAAFDAWEPVEARLSDDGSGVGVWVSTGTEEIYDRPFDGRDLDDASDVVPLMRAVARRDRAGDPECVAGEEPSPNTGWPVALASTRFAKPHAPGPDVVVGLDPFGFDAADVRAFVEAVVFDLWGAADR